MRTSRSGASRSTRPVASIDPPPCFAKSRFSTGENGPWARTRKVPPPRRIRAAVRGIEDHGPSARTRSTYRDNATRSRAPRDGRGTSTIRSCGVTETLRTVSRSASRAARASARGSVGCSRESSKAIRTTGYMGAADFKPPRPSRSSRKPLCTPRAPAAALRAERHSRGSRGREGLPPRKLSCDDLPGHPQVVAGRIHRLGARGARRGVHRRGEQRPAERPYPDACRPRGVPETRDRVHPHGRIPPAVRDARNADGGTRGPGEQRERDPVLQAVRIPDRGDATEVLHGRRGRIQDGAAPIGRRLSVSLSQIWKGPGGLSSRAWLFRYLVTGLIALVIAAQGVVPNEYKFVLFLALIVGGIAAGIPLREERSALAVGFIIGFLGYAAGTLVFRGFMIASSNAAAALMVAELIGVVFVALVFGLVAGGVTGVFAALVPLARRRSRIQSRG